MVNRVGAIPTVEEPHNSWLGCEDTIRRKQMPLDRNGIKLAVSDSVMLSPAMAVDGFRIGTINAIDGDYILVFLSGLGIVVERYGNEMEKVG